MSHRGSTVAGHIKRLALLHDSEPGSPVVPIDKKYIQSLIEHLQKQAKEEKEAHDAGEAFPYRAG